MDERWHDVPDYILGVTKEIWEDRRIHTLEHRYAPGIVVRSPASVVVGNVGVIAATMATLARMTRAEMSAVPETYDRACRLELPGGVTAHGTAAADEFWMSLRAALPSATFRVEHVIGMEETHAAPRAAVRWSLHGRHDGFGAFGAPTGAEVYVLGIGHAEFGPRGLRREWVMIDETAVWKQIPLQTG